MGRKSVVVAVLLEHSVNTATSRHSRMEMAEGGMLSRGVRLSPSQVDRPESCTPWGGGHGSAPKGLGGGITCSV